MLTANDIEDVVVDVILYGVLDIRILRPVHPPMAVYDADQVRGGLCAHRLAIGPAGALDVRQDLADAAVEGARKWIVPDGLGHIGRIPTHHLVADLSHAFEVLEVGDALGAEIIDRLADQLRESLVVGGVFLPALVDGPLRGVGDRVGAASRRLVRIQNLGKRILVEDVDEVSHRPDVVGNNIGIEQLFDPLAVLAVIHRILVARSHGAAEILEAAKVIAIAGDAALVRRLVRELVAGQRDGQRPGEGVETVVELIAPGLIVMAMMQNAFANASFSFLSGKIQGTIIDLLMPPLSEGELMAGIVLAAMTRAVAVGAALALAIALYPGADLHLAGWGGALAIVWFGLMGAAMLSLFGLVTSLWAEKFDHNAAITTLVVAPLALLSGTFYLIDNLAPLFQTISRLNPFFYVISGFRYGFLGASDIGAGTMPVVWAGIGLGAFNLALAVICYKLLKSGWKIKA